MKPILDQIKKLIPPMKLSKMKGEMGRIAIIGGSTEYSGAAYFTGMAALKTGADLVHIFCEESAGTVIKSYSPELIVHPYLISTASLQSRGIGAGTNAAAAQIKEAAHRINDWLKNIHVIVVGPGLSRDVCLQRCVKEIVRGLHEHRRIPLIFDGDGIWFVENNLLNVIGYREAIVTPNVREYERLCKALDIEANGDECILSKKLGGATVIRKGLQDVCANSHDIVDFEGCPRRCGGQGDILAGCVATFLYWFTRKEMSDDLYIFAGAAGCILLKQSSNIAYGKYKRAMDHLLNTYLMNKPMLKGLLLFTSIWIFRVIISLFIFTYHDPDEYWQSLEPAHRIVFGNGYLTWEWHEQIRSYLFPLMFALPYKILQHFDLDYAPFTDIGPKIVQGFIAAIGDYYVMKLANRLFDGTCSWIALFLSLGYWLNLVFASRTLINPLESSLTVLIFYFWPKNPTFFSCLFPFFLISWTFTLRPSNLAFWVVPGLLLLFNTKSISKSLAILTYGAFIMTLVSILNVLIDYSFYGAYVFPFYNFLRFNLSFSAIYGSHPWHWYLTIFTASHTSFLPFFLLGLVTSRNWTLFWACLFYGIILSFLAHKEIRFLMPVIQCSIVYVSKGLRKISSWKYFKAVFALLLVPHIIAAIYLNGFHQSGPLSAVSHLRNQMKFRDLDVLFLMPCHSTPYYAYFHKNVKLDFLRCDPTIAFPNSDKYVDQDSEFYADPEKYLLEYFKHSNPSDIVFFEILRESIISFLETNGYKQTFEGFHSHVNPDDRRKGSIMIYSK